jgi:hypothetical protein
LTPDEKTNERLKLFATALINVAVGFVVVGLVTPVLDIFPAHRPGWRRSFGS